MANVLVTNVTCPSCRNPFPAPIEQVIDVRADPSAKARLLSGTTNVVRCPHCGAVGKLNVPLFYHDPDKQLALVYMPMEAGRTNTERQKFIGSMTQAVMEQLPPEARKGYLFQPQEFFDLQNMVMKVLEADGVTQEMLDAQRAKADLLQRMLDTDSEAVLDAMIRANDEQIDATFFQILAVRLELAQGTPNELSKLLNLRAKLLELTTTGRQAAARGKALEALRGEPTREKLLELLAESDPADEQLRRALIATGRPLLDYPFFQALTQRVEQASGDEKERLMALRKEILAFRDELDEQVRSLFEARAALLSDALMSRDPALFLESRAAELDEAFLNVLAANMEEARARGDTKTVEALQQIWQTVMQMLQESVPPEVQFLNALLTTEDDNALEELLQENREMLTPAFSGLLDRFEESLRADEETEAADRVALVRSKVAAINA